MKEFIRKYLPYVGVVGIIGLLGLFSVKSLGAVYNPSASGDPVQISEVATQTVTPAGPDTLTNGGFESDYTGWTTTSVQGVDFTVTTTNPYAGAKSAQLKMTANTDMQGPPAGLLLQAGGSYTPGQELNTTFALKAGNNSSASTSAALIFINNDFGSFDHIFNFTTGNWDATSTIGQENAGTFDLSQGGGGMSTSTWSYYDWSVLQQDPQGAPPPLTAPPSGNINVVFRVDGNIGDIVLFDAFTITSASSTTENPVAVNLFNYKSTSSTLTANSTFCFVHTTDGTCLNGIDGLGNLIKTTVLVGTSTDPLAAVNKLGAVSVLGESATVDLKVVTTTVLYTVPTGYSAYIEGIDFDGTLNNYTVGFAGSIGSNVPDYNNYNTYPSVSSLFSTGKVTFGAGGGLNAFTGRAKYSAGDVITINVTTGATATTLSGVFRVIGYLVPN